MRVARVILETNGLDGFPADGALYFRIASFGKLAHLALTSSARLRISSAALHVHAAALAQVAVQHGVSYITHCCLLPFVNRCRNGLDRCRGRTIRPTTQLETGP